MLKVYVSSVKNFMSVVDLMKLFLVYVLHNWLYWKPNI